MQNKSEYKNNNLTNLAVVDTATGELDRFLTIGEKRILDDNYTTASPYNKKDNFKSDGMFQLFISEECGTFNHSYYDGLLRHKYLFRFVYLCTFVNYKGYIEFGKAKEECKLASSKTHLKEILGLKNKQFYDTINYFIDNKMITISKEGYINVNEIYCNRGKLMKDNKGSVVRMFDDAIREIYINSSVKEHEKLGMLIKLLPYIHCSSNALVHNPKEKNTKNIKPLKQKDILEILGITKPTSNSLLGIKMYNGEEYALIKVSNGSFKNLYYINPRLAYKGNEKCFTEANDCLNLFKMGIK